MKKQVGIWLDFREAQIIQINEEEVDIQHIDSEVETHNLVGGARSKTPWGPMDKTSESKHLARRVQQEKNYYERIMKAIADQDEVYIIGPSEAKIGLQKYLEGQNSFQPKVLAVEPADSMTTNQKVAQVRGFFNP